MESLIKTPQEIRALRESCRMLAEVLTVLKREIDVGMTTADIDQRARQEMKALGGKPAFYGYQGFPGAVCTSINDEVVHGIPSHQREIMDGDLVSIDGGVDYKGMISDSAFTVIAGSSTPEKSHLLEQTHAALKAGIAAIKGGVRIGTVSAAIEDVLNRGELGIVRDLVGHGVGRALHEEPEIPNFGEKNTGGQLLAGMTIAVEPMATLGGWKVSMNRDGWTITTRDNSLSAHFEHSILVTDTGAEVLTEL